MQKFQHTTWYRLVDGTQADPNDVAPDDKGVLRHKNGIAVAMRSDGIPQTCGARDAVANKNVEAAKTDATRDLKADKPKGGYKTRDLKAD